jgi:hypothetical protein
LDETKEENMKGMQNTYHDRPSKEMSAMMAGFSAAMVVVILLAGIVGREWKLVRKPQAGACVVHAAEECAKHADAKILMVRYNEVAEGHAYAVFREGGYTYAYDWRGPVVLDTPDLAMDAKSVAVWLTMTNPPLPGLTVKSAAYEWSSK